MSFITVSDHAKERGIQRFWLNSQQLRDMAEQAVTEGYSINDAPTKEISQYLQQKAGDNNAYGYAGYIFILSEHMVLITTFRMPMRLLKQLEPDKNIA